MSEEFCISLLYDDAKAGAGVPQRLLPLTKINDICIIHGIELKTCSL